MKAYVWRRVEHATSAYHHEGGVLAVAADLSHARLLIDAKTHVDDEPACSALDTEPDLVLDVSSRTLPTCLVFPDSGCC